MCPRRNRVPAARGSGSAPASISSQPHRPSGFPDTSGSPGPEGRQQESSLAHKALCSPDLLPPAWESRERPDVAARDPSSAEWATSLSPLFLPRGTGLEILYAHCFINKTLGGGVIYTHQREIRREGTRH